MHSQVLNELTDIEKMLIETQELVETKGKVGVEQVFICFLLVCFFPAE
jgi:hypothetical protein